MQSVSSDFTTAAQGTIRKPRVKVEITWTDPFIDTSVVPTSSYENNVSVIDHLSDTISNTPRKYLLLDGKAVADGSFFPFPGTTVEKNNNQVGWYNNALCDASGNFSAPYPSATIEFDQRPIFAVYVHGESTLSEYPVDFTIQIYRDVTLLSTLNITDNDSAVFQYSVYYPAVTRMVLTISKWVSGSTTLKVTEFYTSIIRTYTNFDICSLSILEEREIRYGNIPSGGISSNEINMSLQNIKLLE